MKQLSLRYQRKRVSRGIGLLRPRQKVQQPFQAAAYLQSTPANIPIRGKQHRKRGRNEPNPLTFPRASRWPRGGKRKKRKKKKKRVDSFFARRQDRYRYRYHDLNHGQPMFFAVRPVSCVYFAARWRTADRPPRTPCCSSGNFRRERTVNLETSRMCLIIRCISIESFKAF